MALEVKIQLRKKGELQGILCVPNPAEGLVIFVHGSGSSRLSPRNQWVAKELQNKNYATLALDLLMEEEAEKASPVFDCELQATRLMEVAIWVENQAQLRGLAMALFGASTGSASALMAAAECPHRFQAVISRGGRPDLAKTLIKKVRAPTLFIVGQKDELVLRLNRLAYEELTCKKSLEIIKGATHLFEEPGALEQVTRLTVDWLDENIKAPSLPFFSRRTAAEQLAKRMKGRKFVDPIVVAIPRGGVVTGFTLAKELHSELALIQARKLRHPFSPEWAVGAICENEEPVLTKEGVRLQNESPTSLKEEIKKEKREIERRSIKFKRFTSAGKISNRTVILTDDGIATGSTILAAAKWIRRQKPGDLIIAIPLAPQDSLRHLQEIADEVVCLASPTPFFSVGEFYREFPQVEDEECGRLLETFSKYGYSKAHF